MSSRFRPVIRVFVSSTFSDLKEERNVLQRKVFPRLENYCLVRGFQFQAIDLRWGVPSEAGLDHRTMQICFDELRRAQEVSPRPNFLVLLGDRYGWQPLAESITEDEFRTLEKDADQLDREAGRDVPAGDSAKRTLQIWYRRDDNAVPTEYVLRSRNEWPDAPEWSEEREKGEWSKVERVLWDVVNNAYPTENLVGRFAHIPGLNEPLPSIVKFQASATEQEIWRGALAVPDAPEHVVAWYRTIRNRDEYLSDERAKDFFDKDPALHGAASDLRDELSRRLHTERTEDIQPVEVDLHPSADDSKLEVTTDHLAKMSDDIEMGLVQIIEKEISEYWRPSIGGAQPQPPVEATGPSEARKLELEAQAHEIFGESRAPEGRFVGRKKELEAIATYLSDQTDRKPLVVYGPSGVGKTALLAQAARAAKGFGCRIIVRFLGTTPQSSNLRSLLSNLCRAMRPAGEVEKGVPAELRELQDEFDRHLAAATQGKPILLFLDALDQLDQADAARQTYWLRTPLKPHVKVVVSCIYDTELEKKRQELAEKTFLEGPEPLNEAYLALEQRKLVDRAIAVESLTADEAMKAMDLWLAQDGHRTGRGRQLTKEQRNAIEGRITPDAATACRRPLYLRVLFEECRLWPSWKTVSVADLGQNTAGLLADLFKRLESDAVHGRILVESALGYIGSARHGLSENEMLEVLWADPDYKQHLDEVSRKNKHDLPPEATRIPIAIWSRLRHDLDPYLAEHAAPGGAVLNFYHREVRLMVEKHFLSLARQRVLRHSRLAMYFQSDRQPWWREADSSRQVTDDEAARRLPNARKADELPKQWLAVAKTAADCGIQSGRDLAADAIEELFQRLDFLEAKAEAGLAFDLVADFAAAVKAITEERSSHRILQLLHCALRRDASGIAERPHLLLQYLWHTCHWYDSPRTPDHCVWKAPADAEKTSWPWNQPGPRLFELTEKWLDQAKRYASFRRPWLRSCRPSGVPLESAVQAVLHGQADSVHDVAITPDGRLVVSRCFDGTVWVWDAANGVALVVHGGHEYALECVAVTPDGRRIVCGCDDNVVRVWDTESGAELAVLRGHEGRVICVAVTPDGRRIVSGSDDKTVRVWDAENGAEVAVLHGHQDTVYSVAVTPDGRRALSAGYSTGPWVWDLETGQCLCTLEGHGGWFNGVSVTPDGRRAMSLGCDYTLRLWDVESSSELAVLVEYEPRGVRLAMTADGRRIIGGSWNTVRVWDAENGVELAVLRGHEDGVHCVGVTPDGRWIVSGSDDRTVRVWDAENGAEVAVFRGHQNMVCCVAVTPDGRRIVSGSFDKTAQVWDPEASKELFVVLGHNQDVFDVAITPDGRRIISGSSDETVRVWNAESGAELAVMRWPEGQVLGLAVSSDGRRAVSASWDKTLRVWDLDSGACLRTLEAHDAPAYCVAMTPDGRIILCGSGDVVQVWDSGSGVELALPRYQDYSARCVAVTADGGRILCGSGPTVRVWDAHTGTEIAVLRGHKSDVNDVAVTPDGKRAVSGSWDKAVRVWDAESGAELAVLQGPQGTVPSVALTPEGREIAATDDSGRTLVWNLDWLAADTPSPFPPPPIAEFFWPGGRVTLCESREYAGVACGKDMIPCRVEGWLTTTQTSDSAGHE